MNIFVMQSFLCYFILFFSFEHLYPIAVSSVFLKSKQSVRSYFLRRKRNMDMDSSSLQSRHFLSSTVDNDYYDQGIDRMKFHYYQYKHVIFPAQYKCYDGFELGFWILKMRNCYFDSYLDRSQIEKLESFDGWSWAPFSYDIELPLFYLRKSFENQKDNENFSQLFPMKNRNEKKNVVFDVHLDEWINSQKTLFQYDRMKNRDQDKLLISLLLFFKVDLDQKALQTYFKKNAFIDGPDDDMEYKDALLYFEKLKEKFLHDSNKKRKKIDKASSHLDKNIVNKESRKNVNKKLLPVVKRETNKKNPQSLRQTIVEEDTRKKSGQEFLEKNKDSPKPTQKKKTHPKKKQYVNAFNNIIEESQKGQREADLRKEEERNNFKQQYLKKIASEVLLRPEYTENKDNEYFDLFHFEKNFKTIEFSLSKEEFNHVYVHIEQYIKKNLHSDISYNYKTEDNFPLGKYYLRLQGDYELEILSEARIDMFAKFRNYWSWQDLRSEDMERYFDDKLMWKKEMIKSQGFSFSLSQNDFQKSS